MEILFKGTWKCYLKGLSGSLTLRVKRPCRVKRHRVKRHKVKRPKVKLQTVKNATKGKTTKGQNRKEYFMYYFRVRLSSDNFWSERRCGSDRIGGRALRLVVQMNIKIVQIHQK